MLKWVQRHQGFKWALLTWVTFGQMMLFTCQLYMEWHYCICSKRLEFLSFHLSSPFTHMVPTLTYQSHSWPEMPTPSDLLIVLTPARNNNSNPQPSAITPSLQSPPLSAWPPNSLTLSSYPQHPKFHDVSKPNSPINHSWHQLCAPDRNPNWHLLSLLSWSLHPSAD